jgi:PAS domain S-box-containing protein
MPDLATWRLRDHIHPDDLAEFTATRDHAVLTRSRWNFEGRILRPDGSIRWIHATSGPSDNDDGLVFDGVLLDVTERKRAEEDRNRIFNLSLDLLCVAGFDGYLRQVNPAWTRALGWSSQELLDRPWIEFVHPDDRIDTARAIEELLTGHPVRSFENRHQCKDGSWRWLSWNSFPRAAEGRFFSVVRDVTEEKKAEEERLRLEANLRHAQKMEAIGTLATGIAHDFNNLLTAISGYADLAKSQIPADHPARQALDVVDVAIRDAGGIANSLLTFSRKTVTGKVAVDLRKLVTDSLKLLRRILPAGITVAEDLPADTPVFVLADVGQIHQVLMNLITNAKDAMPDGGTIRVRLSRENGAVLAAESLPSQQQTALLVVEDTGIGMTPAIAARVFDPFFTTKPRGKGTGLGMAIVHGIIQEHEGRITVDTAPGQGTRISVRLPCCEPPASVARETEPEQIRTARHEMTILLAEDETFIRTLVGQSLAAVGSTVIDASNGAEALSAFHANAHVLQLAILDIELPQASGWHCLEEIRKVRPELPVILITGNPEFTLDEDADDNLVLLRKPFKMINLINLAASMILSVGDERHLRDHV